MLGGGLWVRAVVQDQCPCRKSRQRAQALSTMRGHRERVATSKGARVIARSKVGQHPDLGEMHLSAQPPACAAVVTAGDA